MFYISCQNCQIFSNLKKFIYDCVSLAVNIFLFLSLSSLSLSLTRSDKLHREFNAF